MGAPAPKPLPGLIGKTLAQAKTMLGAQGWITPTNVAALAGFNDLDGGGKLLAVSGFAARRFFSNPSLSEGVRDALYIRLDISTPLNKIVANPAIRSRFAFRDSDPPPPIVIAPTDADIKVTGAVLAVHEPPDKFTTAVKIVTSVMATMMGDVTALVVSSMQAAASGKGAKGFAGVAVSAIGGNMDLLDAGVTAANDAVDYAAALDSFNFTSGESLSAFSDAQNVSFGFDMGSMIDPGFDMAGAIVVPGTIGLPDVTLGATPEVATSAYGADMGGYDITPGDYADVSLPVFSPPEMPSGSLVPSLAKIATRAGGGKTGPRNAAPKPTQNSPITGLRYLLRQLEGAVGVNNVPQLAPAKKANAMPIARTGPIGGQINQTLIVAGFGLIAAYMLWR